MIKAALGFLKTKREAMEPLRLLLLLVFVLLLEMNAEAQSYLQVKGQVGRNESGFVLHRSPNDEIYLGGSVNDSALVQRIDADGTILWSRSFKPPGQYAKNVVHLSSSLDGSLIGCGTGYVNGAEKVEGFHFKISNAGVMLWVRSWNDPNIYERRIHAISATEYIVFGGYYSATSTPYSDIISARVDASSGVINWVSGRLDQYSPVPYISDLGSVATLGSAHYVASSIFTGGSPLSTRRVGLSKFDLSGQHLNTQYLVYSNTANNRMVTSDIIANNDSLTMTYFGNVNGSTADFSVGLIRMDTIGNIAWARDFNVAGSSQEDCSKVLATSFGYVLAGRTVLTNPGRYFLMAISLSGDLLWTKSYGPPGQDQVAVDRFSSNLIALDDGFLLTGTIDLGGGEKDLLLIRTDLNGDVSCTDVQDPVVVSSIIPNARFPSPVQEMNFSATLTMLPTVVSDVPFPDDCSLLLDLGNDTSLCGSIQLIATVPNASYLWQDGSTSDSFTVVTSGVYWVDVTVNCCTRSDTIIVSQGSALPAMEDVSLCYGQEVYIGPVGQFEQLLWSTGEVADSILVGVGEYSYYTVDLSGCSSADTVQVIATGQDLGPLDLPNVITPNGDGINDRFQPSRTDLVDYSLSVFDRWGIPVWKTSDPFGQWNGTSNGMDVPSGTYFYVLRTRSLCAYDYDLIETKGHLTLIR